MPYQHPTLEDYKKFLESHDWTYMMSDDHSVYMRGSDAENRLMHMANEGGALYKKAFNAEYAKQFHRKPFCKPYTFPYPEVEEEKGKPSC